MSIKKNIMKMVESQIWSYRIFEEYAVYHKTDRWKKKLLFLASIPFVCIAYPFRKRSLGKYVSDNYIYELGGEV